ncbi:hypothetical protein N752_20310 [Desulforamulus aquiferis]|nr:hypothetical protein N752_20310 [Desulforamulus aquiferis]
MFQRFTERAQKVLVLAQEEARRLKYPFIGTEHILLGLIKEGDGVAAKVLEQLGVSTDKVVDAVEQMVEMGEQPVTADIPPTPRAKKVLELSVEESRRLGHNYVGTEHLLLGLIKEGEGVAARC